MSKHDDNPLKSSTLDALSMNKLEAVRRLYQQFSEPAPKMLSSLVVEEERFDFLDFENPIVHFAALNFSLESPNQEDAPIGVEGKESIEKFSSSIHRALSSDLGNTQSKEVRTEQSQVSTGKKKNNQFIDSNKTAVAEDSPSYPANFISGQQNAQDKDASKKPTSVPIAKVGSSTKDNAEESGIALVENFVDAILESYTHKQDKKAKEADKPQGGKGRTSLAKHSLARLSAAKDIPSFGNKRLQTTKLDGRAIEENGEHPNVRDALNHGPQELAPASDRKEYKRNTASLSTLEQMDASSIERPLSAGDWGNGKHKKLLNESKLQNSLNPAQKSNDFLNTLASEVLQKSNAKKLDSSNNTTNKKNLGSKASQYENLALSAVQREFASLDSGKTTTTKIPNVSMPEVNSTSLDMDAEKLTSLVNDVLVEQARRNGVDLS